MAHAKPALSPNTVELGPRRQFFSTLPQSGRGHRITLQPLARFALDAAIVFSDILTIPDAMGLGLYFVEGEGPRFERPLQHEEDIRRLVVPEPVQHLRYVLDTVRQARQALAGRVPLIGFAGSPFTLACYMVKGGSSATSCVQAMLYCARNWRNHLHGGQLPRGDACLNAQIDAGADAVMIFDTWGGTVITTAAFANLPTP